MKTETITNTPKENKTALKKLGASLRWTRASYLILSGFLMLIFLIGYVWWPLVEEYIGYFNPDFPIWQQVDWLLVGIFLFMSMMIMAGADLKTDLPILLIGLVGGLAIEGWGTQTEIWTYYTLERPPLWIIPAWPIASLSIDRLYRLLRAATHAVPERWFNRFYWLVMPSFYGLMLVFVWPTIDKSLTILALTLCLLLLFALQDRRGASLVFSAGAGLGYFLEVWGTTRECWTYYTQQTPPLFAVLAHGTAALAFWWGFLLYSRILAKYRPKLLPNRSTEAG